MLLTRAHVTTLRGMKQALRGAVLVGAFLGAGCVTPPPAYRPPEGAVAKAPDTGKFWWGTSTAS